MKPKNLKCPFTWETRCPLFVDGVLFVPEYFFAHAPEIFPGFSDPRVFARPAPVFIEYCSGNGAWIIDKALAHPELNWVAVEKRFDRVRKIWSKMRNKKLDNLLIVCGEALPFSEHYLPEHSVAGCYINFPDPWPKEKHAKHRLFHPSFVAQLARTIVPEGKAVIVTDEPSWTEEICGAMLASPSWTANFPSPYFLTEWPGYGTSYFNALWLEKGKTIHYMQFTQKYTL